MYYKKAIKYFSSHPIYNAIVHLLAGVGVGILIARPFDQGHPVQLAGIFIAAAVIGHLIPFLQKNKKS